MTKPIPELVRAILRTAGRLRRQGRLSASAFEAQMSRLVREELEPRRLALLTEQGDDGCYHFFITNRADGTVCESIDCADWDDLAETDHSEGVEAGNFSQSAGLRP